MNKNIGYFVLVFVLGIILIACEHDPVPESASFNFDGTWLGGGLFTKEKYIFDNGNFEYKQEPHFLLDFNGTAFGYMGYYFTREAEIIFVITDVVIHNYQNNIIVSSSDWYTKNEYIKIYGVNNGYFFNIGIYDYSFIDENQLRFSFKNNEGTILSVNFVREGSF